MKLVNAVLVFMFAAVLGGCGGSSPDGDVRVSCADVHNEGQVGSCAAQPRSLATAAVVPSEFDLGTVTLSETIQFATVIQNTGSDFEGYYDVVLNMDCHSGDPVWQVIRKNRITVPGASSITLLHGASCGADPGEYTADIRIYEADTTTVHEHRIGHYTLTP